MLNYYNSTQQMNNLQTAIDRLTSAQLQLNELNSIIGEHWKAEEAKYVSTAIQQRNREINAVANEIERIKENIRRTIVDIKSKGENND